MTKVILNDLANLQNENTAVATINDNNQTIEEAFDNTLSRDGSTPNQMEADLDMNSNRIINLPAAISDTEPVRKKEIDSIVLGKFEGIIGTVNIADGAVTTDKLAPGSVTPEKLSGGITPSNGMYVVNSVDDLLLETVPADVDIIYIAQYYKNNTAQVGLGGHHRLRVASRPTYNTAWDQDASGAYWMIKEENPNLFQYGGVQTGSFDNSIPLNRYISYANDPTIPARVGAPRSMKLPGGIWNFYTRPSAIRAAIAIVGDGVTNTYIYRQYEEDATHGLFTILGDDQTGFRLENCTVVSTATSDTGDMLYAYSGRRTDVTFSGTPQAGSVISCNINYSAANHIFTYTVQNGDTLKDIAGFLLGEGLNYSANANATLVADGFKFSSSDHGDHVIFHITGSDQLTHTVTCTSTGSETIAVSTTTDKTAGYIFMDKVVVSSGGHGWAFPVRIDGTLKQGNPIGTAPLGVRTIRITDCVLFGGGVEGSLRLDLVEHCSINNTETVEAGGVSGDIRIGGSATLPSEGLVFIAHQTGGDIFIDRCIGSVFLVGETQGAISTTNNFTNSVYITGRASDITGWNAEESTLICGETVYSSGIRFKNNFSSLSSDVNVLDAYEEGTFTPVITGGTTSGIGTYSVQSGKYTKVGNRVDFFSTITWSAHSGTGSINISLPPYTVNNSTVPGSITASGVTFTGSLGLYIGQVGGSFAEVVATSSNAAIAFPSLPTSGTLNVSGTYWTNS